jgi:exonuclease SbcC
MEKRLEGVRPLGELEGLLQKVETADYEQKEAQRILGLAVGRQGAANDVLKLLEDRTGKAASIFEDAVRSVVELGPPNIDRRNLTEAWKALLAWATERAAEMDAEKARLDLEGLEAAEAKNALMLIAANSAMEAGLAAESGHEREACLSAIAGLRADATRCEQDLEAAKGLTAELKTLKDEFKLFNGVRLHLSANRFETWYLNRTFHRLCAVASERLKQLSSGQYSISVTNKNEFQVVDHLNAGEKRSVKTLSGGETFLASLSLALALAEEVSQSSAGTKLESLFLDEGFGTLDPDTLDIVSSAIEELGSRGQMIGVITHVREFAERVPVRFEVRKEAKGSRLEKVMA